MQSIPKMNVLAANQKIATRYLEGMQKASEHYTIEKAAIWYWSALFFLGVAVLFVPFLLSFYNPYFAQSDKVFFNWMWPIYLGGSVMLLLSIFLHDRHAEFCTVKLAQNHVFEMGILICMRSLWWTALQAWSWSQSYWYLIPILLGYAMEGAFYAITLWGRHRRTCPFHHNAKEPDPADLKIRPFLLFLNFSWFVAQAMQLIVGILYDDELFM